MSTLRACHHQNDWILDETRSNGSDYYSTLVQPVGNLLLCQLSLSSGTFVCSLFSKSVYIDTCRGTVKFNLLGVQTQRHFTPTKIFEKFLIQLEYINHRLERDMFLDTQSNSVSNSHLNPHYRIQTRSKSSGTFFEFSSVTRPPPPDPSSKGPGCRSPASYASTSLFSSINAVAISNARSFSFALEPNIRDSSALRPSRQSDTSVTAL